MEASQLLVSFIWQRRDLHIREHALQFLND
jgi:hypothetical protein